MSWYFVCACNAKWFAPVSSVACPRCGTPSTSTETLTPPWELENEVSEKKKELASIRGLSDQACFICGSDKKTANVTLGDGTFRGVLCMDCVHAKMLKPTTPRVAKTA